MSRHETEKDVTDVVALVGRGGRGRALLAALMEVPGLEVRYYFDADPASPGVALAREREVRWRADGRFDELRDDGDVDLVLDATGAPDVLEALAAARHPDTRLLDPVGARVLLSLLAAGAETADRARVDMARYLRQASHQVKTPLSAIQTYVNVILGGYTGEVPERTREVVAKIHSRCEAALRSLAKRRLLADLRCNGRDGLETSAVHLNELAGEAVDLHAALASSHGVEVRLLAHEGVDLVRCDPQRIVALLSELVENAVVYSRPGGVIEVAVRPAPCGGLAAAVRDRGIGIPQRCLPRVFAEDYRADPAVKHHPDGAGLGLAIAREVADLHGFDLRAESEDGHGSVFTLTVPLATATER